MMTEEEYYALEQKIRQMKGEVAAMEASEITINGVVYAQKQAYSDIKIIVLDRGFVYVGRVVELDDRIEVHDAKNIIRWGTSSHLAELTDGPLANTKLGATCSFTAYKNSVLQLIDLNQENWGREI